uniref:Heat shock protein beta-1 n=1 Tax=Caligus clemensi TaxID=344056 RepID=C1C2K8_CALCM|nr:Heat shock protein beta-1 [Caligus clemensi]
MPEENGDRVPVTLRDFFWNDPFFSSTWDDFHKVQEQMMKRSHDMFERFQEDAKKMEGFGNSSSSSQSYSVQSHSSSSSDKKEFPDKSVSSERKESSSSSTTGGQKENQVSHKEESIFLDEGQNRDFNPFLFSRRWLIPSIFRNDFTKDLNIFQDKDEQVIRIKDEEDKFEISLDTHQYRPDEPKVNIKDGVVSIEAKHEEKSEDGRKSVSRQFVRKYTLPKNTKPESVNSNLSSDGVLVISAPKMKPIVHEGERAVPITMKS